MNFITSLNEVEDLKRRATAYGLTVSDLIRAAIRIGLQAIDDNPQLLLDQMKQRRVPVTR